MKHVLITGAAGFVGRHFRTALSNDNDVLAIDSVWEQDARDLFRGRIWPVINFDLVIHAAAHVGGRADIDGRPTYIGAHNLQLDAALFEWALRAKPDRILYLSSSAVYPVDLQAPVDLPVLRGSQVHVTYSQTRLREDDVDLEHPQLPDATYGWTKLTGERLAAEYAAEGGRVHVVRPFSGYGEDQSTDYPFPSFAARARSKQFPFQVWGNGAQVRDWIHIDDVVNAALTIIEQDVREPVNLCSGLGIEFDELARMFMRAAGYRAEIEHLSDAPAGVAHRVGDPNRMLQVYTPKIGLDEGIQRALASGANK